MARLDRISNQDWVSNAPIAKKDGTTHLTSSGHRAVVAADCPADEGDFPSSVTADTFRKRRPLAFRAQAEGSLTEICRRSNNRTRLLSGVASPAQIRAPLPIRGGMRRTWLRGRENVHKRYLLHVAGHNLDAPTHRRRHPEGGRGGRNWPLFVLVTPAGAGRSDRPPSRRMAKPPSPRYASPGVKPGQ